MEMFHFTCVHMVYIHMCSYGVHAVEPLYQDTSDLKN